MVAKLFKRIYQYTGFVYSCAVMSDITPGCACAQHRHGQIVMTLHALIRKNAKCVGFAH